MSRPIRVLELRSVRGSGGGPEKTILYGAAQSDPSRFAVTVCYLRDRRDAIFAIDKQARQLGLDYVEVRERHSFDVSVWRALRQLVRERNIDIVHAHDYKTDLLALLLSQGEDVIPLATVHHWVGTGRRERVYYWCDKRVLRWFPRLIAVSQSTRALLTQAGVDPARICVILNGIDAEKFRREPARVALARRFFQVAPGDVVLGAVCRLDPEKRLDMLLHAFVRLRRMHPELRLLIAGQGSQQGALAALAEQLGQKEACRFLGHCADVIGLHHALDIFVQSSSAEGTSNALLEAMALETPVVATTAGGTAELMADGSEGLLVPTENAAALTAAIRRVLDDPHAARRRASAARQRVEMEFSFHARMAKVEAIYEELVENHKRLSRAR